MLSILFRVIRNRLQAVRSLPSGSRAAVAMIVGLALPVLIGAAGLAVDAAYWYAQSQSVQTAADAGAMAAARVILAAPQSEAAVATNAANIATHNQFNFAANSPNTISVSQQNNQVTVIAAVQAPLFLSRVVFSGPVAIRASASAGIAGSGGQGGSNPPGTPPAGNACTATGGCAGAPVCTSDGCAPPCIGSACMICTATNCNPPGGGKVDESATCYQAASYTYIYPILAGYLLDDAVKLAEGHYAGINPISCGQTALPPPPLMPPLPQQAALADLQIPYGFQLTNNGGMIPLPGLTYFNAQGPLSGVLQLANQLLNPCNDLLASTLPNTVSQLLGGQQLSGPPMPPLIIGPGQPANQNPPQGLVGNLLNGLGSLLGGSPYDVQCSNSNTQCVVHDDTYCGGITIESGVNVKFEPSSFLNTLLGLLTGSANAIFIPNGNLLVSTGAVIEPDTALSSTWQYPAFYFGGYDPGMLILASDTAFEPEAQQTGTLYFQSSFTGQTQYNQLTGLSGLLPQNIDPNISNSACVYGALCPPTATDPQGLSVSQIFYNTDKAAGGVLSASSTYTTEVNFLNGVPVSWQQQAITQSNGTNGVTQDASSGSVTPLSAGQYQGGTQQNANWGGSLMLNASGNGYTNTSTSYPESLPPPTCPSTDLLFSSSTSQFNPNLGFNFGGPDTAVGVGTLLTIPLGNDFGYGSLSETLQFCGSGSPMVAVTNVNNNGSQTTMIGTGEAALGPAKIVLLQ